MSAPDLAARSADLSTDCDDRTLPRRESKAAADAFEWSADDPRAKADPEKVSLRAQATHVVRFRRGLLVGAAGGVLTLLVVAAWFALEPTALSLAAEEGEAAPVPSGEFPDELDRLPSGYGDGPSRSPLGPPLPGDLGRPVLEHQRAMATEANATPPVPVAPDGRAQAIAAERERRLAEFVQARNAPVLMQVSRSAGEGSRSRATMVNSANLAGVDGDDATPDPGLNPNRLRPAASRWQISAGSMIAASLVTGLNSDLPGIVVAQVTEPVSDSATGRAILIPQGSRLLGRYDSKVAFGQRRAMLVWERLILPDGSSIALDHAPATDAAGFSGIADGVDFHTWRLLRGIGMSTLLGIGTELTLGDGEGDLIRALRESIQTNADRAGQKIVERNLDVAPTLTVRPGFPVRVLVHKDLVLPPWKG